MPQEITATILIKFAEFEADDLAGILVSEIDDREDGFNNGDISFQPGDQIVYLVYKNNKVADLQGFSSTGNIVTIGVGTRSVMEQVSFINTDTTSLRLPVKTGTGIVPEWMDKNRGPVNLGADGATLTLADGKNTGILQVTYITEFTAYRLENVPSLILGKPEFPILIVTVGTLLT